MQCFLYINNSDDRYLNKSLTQKYELDVEYKEDTSHSNPTFIISGNYAVKDINYIYVPYLNRYYYVNGITYSKQRIFLDCHVDILMSFNQAIKDDHAIIKRNQYNFDLYLNDEKMKLKGYQSIRTLRFPYSLTNTSQQFILGIVGGNVYNNGGSGNG